MGTSNFHYRNTKVCYSVLTEIEEPQDAEWMQIELIDNISEKMNEVFGNFFEGGSDPHESRSYPSVVIGSSVVIRRTKTSFGSVEITAILRCGYYQGACLDWNIAFTGWSETWDDLPELEDLASDIAYMNQCKTNSSILKKAEALLNWMEKTKDSMVDKLETIFSEHSVGLRRVATFSNGETIYEEVKK
jgi:hypothetical protein